MPFFFILPVWIVCLIAGAALLCARSLRFLASYVLLGSTGFAIGSFAFSTLVLFIAGRSPGFFLHSGLLVMGSYIGAVFFGGVCGSLAGLILAWRINERVRWLGGKPDHTG